MLAADGSLVRRKREHRPSNSSFTAENYFGSSRACLVVLGSIGTSIYVGWM